MSSWHSPLAAFWSEPSGDFETLARPEGLEPPAYWFEANRSIQLSYGRGSGDCDLMVSSRGPR
jgi:hypothetical protein